jgi:hypothetical protein
MQPPPLNEGFKLDKNGKILSSSWNQWFNNVQKTSTSITYANTGVVPSQPPNKIGDIHVDTKTNTIYVGVNNQSNSGWVTGTGGGIVGPQGAVGPMGPMGLQGLQGTPGTPGTFSFYQISSTVGSNPTIAVDWSVATVQEVLLGHTGTATITLSNAAPGGTYRLIIQQSNVGGNLVNCSIAGVKWVFGILPIQTLTLTKKDILTFLYDGTDYLGEWAGNF